MTVELVMDTWISTDVPPGSMSDKCLSWLQDIMSRGRLPCLLLDSWYRYLQHLRINQLQGRGHSGSRHGRAVAVHKVTSGGIYLRLQGCRGLSTHRRESFTGGGVQRH